MTTNYEKINIILAALNAKDDALIINTIRQIHPIFLLYINYNKMLDRTILTYLWKLLNKSYFSINIEDAYKIFININDAKFVNYALEYLLSIDYEYLDYNNFKDVEPIDWMPLNTIDVNKYINRSVIDKYIQIIKKMIEYYIKNDDIDNLNFIKHTKLGDVSQDIIDWCVYYNKTYLL